MVVHFWICDGLNADSSDKMVMIILLASSHLKLDIRETLSINFHCVWAPSIDDVNTESAFSYPTLVLRPEHSLPIECNSLIQDVAVETGLHTDVSMVSDFLFCQLYLICPFHFPVTRHQPGAA